MGELAERFASFHGLDEICQGYFDKLGIPLETNAVHVRKEMNPFFHTPIIVRLRLDGYEVQFFHNENFDIPPHSQWGRQGDHWHVGKAGMQRLSLRSLGDPQRLPGESPSLGSTATSS